jgi:hypothetical protein
MARKHKHKWDNAVWVYNYEPLIAIGLFVVGCVLILGLLMVFM